MSTSYNRRYQQIRISKSFIVSYKRILFYFQQGFIWGFYISKVLFKFIFYRRYVDDIFVLFKSTDHLKKNVKYFNTCHRNMPFSFEMVKCPF